MDISLRKLSMALGAEVIGADLSKPLDDDAYRQIRAAFSEHCILLFRGARISPQQQIDFSSRFGALAGHVIDEFKHPEYPDIFVVSNIREGEKLKGAVYAGQYWHSDISYVKPACFGSLLRCLETPEVGGDTMYANMYLAYEALSGPMKQFLGGLTAIHDYNNAYTKYFARRKERPPLTEAQKAQVPPVEHPVVRTIPETGRKALYVNPGFTTGIVGMSEQEGKAILEFLFQHSIQPEFIYRHKWRQYDMILWDNRCTTHYALADYDFSVRRLMHRTTVVL